VKNLRSLAAAAIVLAALTGCASHTATRTATTPESTSSPVASAAPTAGDDLDSITQELNDVDNSIAQANSDSEAGDAAAAQGDQP